MIFLKISLEWLKDYVEIGTDVKKLSDDFTVSGSEIEEIEKPFEKIHGIISARVDDVNAHPNADNLNVCKVYDGTKTYTIITSDKTVNSGDFVAFGPAEKASDVNGKIVKSIDMRGIETDGMILSLEELGLESHSSHVFRFEKPVRLGIDIIELLDLDQTVLELEITPNRPDCLSHIGLARELATVRRKTLKTPETFVNLPPSGGISVSIDSNNCSRYMAVRVDGVTVKDSPLWLKRRLASVGMRAINNIADITNYVMMEMGHPVHAFDFDEIPSSKIVVKDATGGEKFSALNSNEYMLNGGEVLITDGTKVLALGGIIGGKNSGISSSTKSVLVEVATFDSVRTRRTSKGLNLSTDASYRFERGVDPNDTEYVAKRIIDMILSLSGGEVVGMTDIYPEIVKPVNVTLSEKKLTSYMSFEPNSQEVNDVFTLLGMKVLKDKPKWNVEVPTFRQDIKQDVDLIEEFARIHGFNAIPTAMSMPFVKEEKNEWWDFKNKMRFLSTSIGYFENVNYAFSDPKIKAIFGNTFDESPKLLNPVSPEMSIMRPTLLINLIDALSYNVKHQENDVKFFEIGKIFKKDAEEEKIGFVSTGRRDSLDYTDKRDNSLLNFKGDMEALFRYLHVNNVGFLNENMDGFVLDRSGKVILNGKEIGIIGELSEEILKRFDLDFPVYAAELDLKMLFEQIGKFEYKPSSQYPVSFRDLSMFISKGKIAASAIIEIARKSSIYVLEINMVDLYMGKGVPPESYGMTIRITYGSMKETLSDQEIDKAFSNLMEILESKDGIILRKAR